MHENRETSDTPAVKPGPQVGGRRLRPYGPHVRLRGVGPRHSTDESFEQGRSIVGGERGGKAVDQGEHFHSTRTRHRAGLRVFHGWASVRTSSRLGRYSSAIRAACANERSCGSVRGAISDGRPYRDQASRTCESCWCDRTREMETQSSSIPPWSKRNFS